MRCGHIFHLAEIPHLFWTILLHNSVSTAVVELMEQAPSGTVLIDNLWNHLPQAYEPGSRNAYIAIGNPLSPGISTLEVRRDQSGNKEQLIVKTGQLGPDREAICKSQLAQRSSAPCDISLLLLHRERQNPSYTAITLRILDRNDNFPKFSGGNFLELRVPEDDSLTQDSNPTLRNTGFHQSLMRDTDRPSRTLPLSVAFDSDLPENGVKSYRLVTTSGKDVDASMFQLVDSGSTNAGDFSFKASTLFTPALKINGPLDREDTADYWLHLLALDGGQPQHTGTLTIHLIVTDVNDNYPSFRQPIYHQPTVQLPTSVLVQQLQQYRQSTFLSHDYQELLDGQAVDHQVLLISELSPVSTELATLTADDEDEGDNGKVTYQLKEKQQGKLDGRVSQLFNLTERGGSVTLCVANPLDADGTDGVVWFDNSREIAGRLVFLSVEAYDAGSPSLKNSTELKVLLMNENDNAPEISFHYVNPVQSSGDHPSVKGAFQENEVGPLVIAHLTVIDNDVFPKRNNQLISSSQNSAVHCMANDSRFSVEQIQRLSQQAPHGALMTGDHGNANPSLHFFRLSVLKPVDREVTDKITVRVDCIDEMPVEEKQLNFHQVTILDQRTRLMGSSTLQFQILDVNDNAPEFTKREYRFTVMETFMSATAGEQTMLESKKLVGKVHATDRDVDSGGRVVYTLLENPGDSFQIDSETGALWCIHPLDREIEAKIEFRVKTEDRGEPVLSDTCLVTVTIGDLNDNPPRWITQLGYRSDEAYRLGSSETNLFYFSVYENAMIDTILGVISAIDADGVTEEEIRRSSALNYKVLSVSDQNANKIQYKPDLGITYHLEDNDDAKSFSINVRTGELRLTQSLDRETRTHYELRAYAVDSPPQLVVTTIQSLDFTHRYTITATIVITVLDVNDNSPQFESPLAGEDFHINPKGTIATAGTRLFVTKAHDADAGENATIRYTLEPNGYGLVDINPTTGVCYLSETLHQGRMSTLLAAKKVPFTKRTVLAGTSEGMYKRFEEVSISTGESQFFILTLTIVAHDLGLVERRNNTRTVSLIWNTNGPTGLLDTKGVKFGYSDAEVLSAGTTLNRSELIVILTVGIIFFLVLITCVLCIAIPCRRGPTRLEGYTRRSAKRMRWSCMKFLLYNKSGINAENEKGDSVHENSRVMEKADLLNKSIYSDISKSEYAQKVTAAIISRPPSSINSFLPDCVPQTRPVDYARMNRYQHAELGASTANYVTGTRVYRLSRVLSEESICSTRPDFGYTSLSAFSPNLPTNTTCRMPQFNKKDANPYFYERKRLHHLQLSPFMHRKLEHDLSVERQRSLLSGQIFVQPEQYHPTYQQDNCFKGQTQVTVDEALTRTICPRSEYNKVEHPQEYEMFEFDSVENHAETKQAQSSAAGSAWTTHSQNCYAENSFI